MAGVTGVSSYGTDSYAFWLQQIAFRRSEDTCSNRCSPVLGTMPTIRSRGTWWTPGS